MVCTDDGPVATRRGQESQGQGEGAGQVEKRCVGAWVCGRCDGCGLRTSDLRRGTGDAEEKGEGVPKIARLRQIARENNPELDLELFRQGYVSTVRSLEAKRLGEALMESQPEMGYFIPKISEDVQKDLGLRR